VGHDEFKTLVEIHAAPRWLWSALVSRMIAEGLTVDTTGELVAMALFRLETWIAICELLSSRMRQASKLRPSAEPPRGMKTLATISKP
jgi:hypothetical protein